MRKRTMRLIRYFLLAFVMIGAPAAALAQVRVSITIAPPELPVYDQPVCPGDGYIWTPGYWAWDNDYNDYYWVPGTWVEAPEVGYFWTPGYWGWNDNGYVFNEGYWGPEVGFYGGIDYGFGYFGEGFVGGRWDNGHFFYNRDVSNVNVRVVRNVYEEKVSNRGETRVSFNGGHGGINARPSSHDEEAAHQRHEAPVAAQREHVQAARSDQQLRASVNHGKPAVAATERPGALHDKGAVGAREGGTVHTAPATGGNPGAAGNNGGRPANNDTRGSNPANNEPRPAGNESRPTNSAVHPKELPPMERPAPPTTGNPKVDKKYQQQQQQLEQKQNQDRQKLQQKQDQEHAKLNQQKAPPARTQQVEQKHQQQTQQLSQKHVQQQQQLQQKQQAKQKPQPKGPPHNGPGGNS